MFKAVARPRLQACIVKQPSPAAHHTFATTVVHAEPRLTVKCAHALARAVSLALSVKLRSRTAAAQLAARTEVSARIRTECAVAAVLLASVEPIVRSRTRATRTRAPMAVCVQLYLTIYTNGTSKF